MEDRRQEITVTEADTKDIINKMDRRRHVIELYLKTLTRENNFYIKHRQENE